MRPLSRLWAVLSSRKLSVWLIALLAVGYAAWVVPFQVYGVPPERVQRIATAIGFRALAVLLLINTIACLIVHTGRVARRVRADFGPSEDALDGESALVLRTTRDVTDAVSHATRVLRRARFHVRGNGHAIRATKGRYSPLGTIVSHAALVLLAVAAVMTSTGTFVGKMVLVEGETADAAERSSYVEPSASEIATVPAGLMPVGTVELVTVDPGFWRDVQLFNKLSARVMIDGEAARIQINEPAPMGGSWIAVDGFGYAPEVRLDRPEGGSESAFLKLKVFPPGSIDSFELPETPYRVDMKVFSDAEITDSGVINRTYNLRDPAIVMRVSDITSSSESGVWQGTLRLGEAAEFEGYTLRVPSIRYYAELRVVRNAGAFWFVAALVLALLGLLMRTISRQRVVLVRVSASDAGGSDVRVVASAEQWRGAFRERVGDDLARALGAAKGEDDGHAA